MVLDQREDLLVKGSLDNHCFALVVPMVVLMEGGLQILQVLVHLVEDLFVDSMVEVLHDAGEGFDSSADSMVPDHVGCYYYYCYSFVACWVGDLEHSCP